MFDLVQYALNKQMTKGQSGPIYGVRDPWGLLAKMFFATIERDGKTMKRFELMEEK